MADDKKKKATVKAEGNADEAEATEQTISLFLAVGLIVSALVVGLIVGYLVAPKGATTSDFGQPAAGTAPSLSPEQLNSQQLPASHPPVEGLTGGETTGGAGTTQSGSPKTQEPAPAD